MIYCRDGASGTRKLMITREQLHDLVTAQPFRPFIVNLPAGLPVCITRPGAIACDPKGREMAVPPGRAR